MLYTLIKLPDIGKSSLPPLDLTLHGLYVGTFLGSDGKGELAAVETPGHTGWQW